nr:MAG TPA: hypothetical protein [Caudoviricetes sp.]DAY81763.1 MAG TPA: hypothetical protein [Caudoviricetes sp.]
MNLSLPLVIQGMAVFATFYFMFTSFVILIGG